MQKKKFGVFAERKPSAPETERYTLHTGRTCTGEKEHQRRTEPDSWIKTTVLPRMPTQLLTSPKRE
jgi:hypothetical protein